MGVASIIWMAMSPKGWHLFLDHYSNHFARSSGMCTTLPLQRLWKERGPSSLQSTQLRRPTWLTNFGLIASGGHGLTLRQGTLVAFARLAELKWRMLSTNYLATRRLLFITYVWARFSVLTLKRSLKSCGFERYVPAVTFAESSHMCSSLPARIT